MCPPFPIRKRERKRQTDTYTEKGTQRGGGGGGGKGRVREYHRFIRSEGLEKTTEKYVVNIFSFVSI